MKASSRLTKPENALVDYLYRVIVLVLDSTEIEEETITLVTSRDSATVYFEDIALISSIDNEPHDTTWRFFRHPNSYGKRDYNRYKFYKIGHKDDHPEYFL